MDRSKLISLEYKRKTYYHDPTLSITDLVDLQIQGKILNFTHGIDGALSTFMFFSVKAGNFSKKTAVGEVVEYPHLFKLFWDSYHPKKRIGKRAAFKKWELLPLTVQDNLPIAAKNYVNNIEATSSHTYMVHPTTFINSALYEDFLEASDVENVIAMQKSFNLLFKQKIGNDYQFTQSEKALLETDVQNIGITKMKELCYIFFNDLDPDVKAVNRNKNYSYNVFSALMKGVLGVTKKKVPKICEYCGKRGGHNLDCPVLTERKLKDSVEKKEVEEARAENIDLMKMFKNEIGR